MVITDTLYRQVLLKRNILDLIVSLDFQLTASEIKEVTNSLRNQECDTVLDAIESYVNELDTDGSRFISE